MLEKEIESHHVLQCLDKKIVNKYKEVYQKEYISNPRKNINIVFEKIIIKYPELDNYPSHEEFMKCYENRQKRYF